jgi:hypothetical protein
MIAAPCNVGWENMKGDDRVRFCGQCQLNVYNTSVMTPAEINDLLSQEGSPCLRLFRRSDGTMITENCPVGLRKIRDGYGKVVRVAAAGWALLISVATSFAQGDPGTKALKPQAGECVDAKGSSPLDVRADGHDASAAAAWATSKADKRAMKELTEARLAASERNYNLAASHYQNAMSAIKSGSHDPKFIRTVYTEYADLVRLMGRNFRSIQVLTEMKIMLTDLGASAELDDLSKADKKPVQEITGMRIEPTLLEIRNARGLRQQQTTPTLPNGAPIPLNE